MIRNGGLDHPEQQVGSSGTAGWIIRDGRLDHPERQVGSSGTAGRIIRNARLDHPERRVGSSGTPGRIIRNGGLDDQLRRKVAAQSRLPWSGRSIVRANSTLIYKVASSTAHRVLAAAQGTCRTSMYRHPIICTALTVFREVVASLRSYAPSSEWVGPRRDVGRFMAERTQNRTNLRALRITVVLSSPTRKPWSDWPFESETY